jgi:hypothetical protein
MPAEDLIFGIDSYMKKEENENFISLIKLPFKKYMSKEETIE